MTMQECYKAIGGNYEAVLGRLHNEALIPRFTLKFLEDQSYLQLKQALENKNYEDAFRSAHTLERGVSESFPLTRLYEVEVINHTEPVLFTEDLIKAMREKIEFFLNRTVGINSIDYNASSGQLTIINEKQKIIYQREDPGFDVFKVFE
ncbi:MAG: Hpt domain-containing protein [Anaerobutyricum soehngenii]